MENLEKVIQSIDNLSSAITIDSLWNANCSNYQKVGNQKPLRVNFGRLSISGF